MSKEKFFKGQEKVAAIPAAFGAAKMAVGIIGGALVLRKAYNAITQDFKRKAIIEDLRRTDPMLRNVSDEQLMEWYATIYHFAPKFSLDKAAVREVLDNFARFGKVDVNTLKMLSETEKASEQAKSEGTSWGSALTSAATNFI